MPAADYVIDTKGAHASVNFTISHLGYSFIHGQFRNFSGEFSFDGMDDKDAAVSVVIDTTSLDTNHAERDKHLRSADFLDAKKFPEAKFVSTKITPLNDKALQVDGLLTLHGQTKPITIDGEFIGEGMDPWGGYRAGFRGETSVSLEDFGITVMGASSHANMELHIEGIRK